MAKRIKSLGHKELIVDFWDCNKPFVNAVKQALLNLKVLANRKEPFIITNKSKVQYFYKILKYFFEERKYKKAFAKIANDFQPDIVYDQRNITIQF